MVSFDLEGSGLGLDRSGLGLAGLGLEGSSLGHGLEASHWPWPCVTLLALVQSSAATRPGRTIS